MADDETPVEAFELATKMPTHTPPKYLVREVLGNEHAEFDDSQSAVEYAQKLARENPGSLIDIYEHRVCVRKSE